jgi:hypothetical protein
MTSYLQAGTSGGSDNTAARRSAVGRLTAMIAEERRAIERIMDSPVRGARKQYLTVADALVKITELINRIDLDEAARSLRHRVVKRSTKIFTIVFLAVIDFPLMLWLSSSVFNVDWADPLGLPLAVSVVIALLGTTGAAWTLYHLGRNRRENKNDRRQMDWPDLSPGAKASLLGVGLLVALIAVVMFVRVYTEGVLSGLDWLALLMAILVAFIMLLSAALVFGTAFRDGSPEQGDLAHYSALVHDAVQRKRAHEDRAARLEHERDLLLNATATARAVHDLASLLGMPAPIAADIGAAERNPNDDAPLAETGFSHLEPAQPARRQLDSGHLGRRRTMGIRRPT